MLFVSFESRVLKMKRLSVNIFDGSKTFEKDPELGSKLNFKSEVFFMACECSVVSRAVLSYNFHPYLTFKTQICEEKNRWIISS